MAVGPFDFQVRLEWAGWYVPLASCMIVDSGSLMAVCDCEFWTCGPGHMLASGMALWPPHVALERLLEGG